MAHADGPDLMSKGHQYLVEKNYVLAADMFEKALLSSRQEGNNIKANQAVQELAIIQLKLKNYVKSEWYFNQLTIDENSSSELLFNYARLQQINGRSEAAAKYYRAWGKASGQMEKGEEFASFCDRQNSLKTNPEIVVNSMKLNTTQYDEYCPHLLASGEMVFTSNRPQNSRISREHGSESPAKLYTTEHISPQSSDKVTTFSSNDDNDLYNRGSACFTDNGKIMYFTANIIKPIKIFSTSEPQFTLGIYQSTHDGYEWGKAELMSFVNANYNTAFPSVSPDGSVMVFSSDMPGSMGGMDLFISYHTGNTWSKPENLGLEVNTVGNEMYPFITSNEGSHKLYFATDGKPGYGGLDIFSANILGTIGDSVSLLPAPVNSPFDDFAYFTIPANTFGYFSSNRAGSDDIYHFQQTDYKAPPSASYRLWENDVAAGAAEAEEELTVESEETASEVEEEVVEVEGIPVAPKEVEKEVIEEKVKPRVVVMPSTKVNTEDAVEVRSLTGYYTVVFSALNFDNLKRYRDQNYPGAMLLKNSNGFYHIAFELTQRSEDVKIEHEKAKERYPNSWVLKGGM